MSRSRSSELAWWIIGHHSSELRVAFHASIPPVIGPVSHALVMQPQRNSGIGDALLMQAKFRQCKLNASQCNRSAKHE
jgi:hypothetical protein